MANEKHIALLKQGVEGWNAWRLKPEGFNPELFKADLRGAKLGGAILVEANLGGANLIEADLSEADLSEADLVEANLRAANLSRANLMHATLIKTNLTDANLTGCHIYGISAWDLNLERAKQENLIITDLTNRDQAEIAVDNIEVAQFIYLLLNNEKIRNVIDTSPPRRCSSSAASRRSAKRSSMPCGRSCGSTVTCQSCSTSMCQRTAISPKRSPYSLAWRGSS
jgi:uncharacterized protein YjbI with pentapeptide repeats